VVWSLDVDSARLGYFHGDILGLGPAGLGIYSCVFWHGCVVDYPRRDLGGHNKSKNVGDVLLSFFHSCSYTDMSDLLQFLEYHH
jgi:hypothetical protein